MSHFIQRKQLQTPLSASYALTASFALNAGGGGAAFPFSGSAVITGSLLVSGSGITITGSLRTPNITGSLFGTASWAISSSRSISSSFATTSSFAVSASRSVSSSFATQAGNATTADYATSAGSTGYAATAGSAGSATTSDQIQISETFEPLDPDGNGLKPFLVPYTPGSGKYYSDLAETTFEIFPIKNQIFFRTGSEGQTAQLLIGQSGSESSGYVIVYGELWAQSLNVLPGTIRFVDNVNTASFNTLAELSYDGNRDSLFLSTGSFSGSFIGSLIGTSSWAQRSITSSFAQRSITASYAETSSITYVTNSNFSLSEIEVADYSNDVAVTFTNGRLKFVFGTPATQSITSFIFAFDDFQTNRFNKVLDIYTASANWSNNGYNLIAANIYEDGRLVATTNTGTSLLYGANQSGSRTYVLHVTASSPLDSSILVVSRSLVGTLNKILPGNPTITASPNVQLGASSNQIEQGATGSIGLFPPTQGTSNSWVHVSTVMNPSSGIFVTGSATGSTSIIISATSSYSSSGVGGSDNDPPLTTSTFATTTYTKIRSLRSGASVSSSFTATELENIGAWDSSSLGGNIGTILKGTTTATGQSVTIYWTGDKYHYIVYNSSLANLTSIKAAGFEVISSFNSPTTVGSYKVYRTTLLQSGYSGTTITYTLT